MSHSMIPLCVLRARLYTLHGKKIKTTEGIEILVFNIFFIFNQQTIII